MSRFCLLSRSRVRDDPRVRRLGDALHRRGHHVHAIGLAGGLCAATAWPVEEVTLGGETLADPRLAVRVAGFAAGATTVALGTALKPLTRWTATLASPLYWSSPTARSMLRRAEQIRADVYVANDWNTLPIAAELAERHRTACWYDAHEYTVEQRSDVAIWRMVHRPFVAAVERRWIHAAAGVSTVSPGIADALERSHALPARPLVVRNAPPRTAATCTPNAPGGCARTVLYQGHLDPRRRIEVAVASVALWRPGLRLVLRGPVTRRYRRRLERVAARHGVSDRVDIEAPVPMTEMVARAAEADIGLIVLPGSTPQYVLSLPLKLFEYWMAGLPVVAPAFPDIASLIAGHGAGRSYARLAPGAIADAINGLEGEALASCRAGARAASERLCWEYESQPLLDALEATARGVGAGHRP